MKEIKNYLHLYLGCKCKGKSGSMVYTLIDVGIDRSSLLLDKYGNECVIFDFKPILRPLSDIKVDELKLLASWSGICSPEDWECVPNEPYKVKHKECENTFEISSIGNDLVSRKSKGWKDLDHTSQQMTIFKQLLDWHFDIFSLIKAGLAIDATTLNEGTTV